MITMCPCIPCGCKALSLGIAEYHSITRFNIILCDFTGTSLEGFSKQFDIIKQLGSVTAYLGSATKGAYCLIESTVDILHVLCVFLLKERQGIGPELWLAYLRTHLPSRAT